MDGKQQDRAGDDRATFDVRVLRQDQAGRASYWQHFRLRREAGLNVIAVLQKIAANPQTVDEQSVAPVAYEANCLEEVCGSCSMLINGRTRQACSALVDPLLADHPAGIELRPMSRFPIVRDLVVDRRRLFRALEKVRAWVPVDGYHDLGPRPRQAPAEQQRVYPLTQCMGCGCCLEACPQFRLIELTRAEGESDASFAARERAEFDQNFFGAHAMNQVVRFNSDPTGSYQAAERLDAAMLAGGVQMCGNAQNCTAVCPKRIPLTDSWGSINRAATRRALQRLLDG